ncbi:ComEA family DNA-binding protein [Coralloluteibacterium thermophilus]|uniref:ComEA family DNA-binding protein n=1 Tax=Coralloluteibacterium thermophilum TaxID=2707049 RepID=A0ABV9NJ31_9GAMM
MSKFATAFHALALAALFALPAMAADKVDINSADAATLERVLVGVGPAKARDIVAYREAHGPFRSADQLAAIKGIGLATVDRNRDLISLGSAPTDADAGAAAGPAAD